MKFQHTAARRRLHVARKAKAFRIMCFNTQPREGGCKIGKFPLKSITYVSTHSRAETAALALDAPNKSAKFQHTAARRRLLPETIQGNAIKPVSTHSRAETAASHSINRALSFVFQHTAARRRLPPVYPVALSDMDCFNTQPPGGGCINIKMN